MNTRMRGILAVAIMMNGVAQLGWANGFALPGLSAEGFGRGEAVVASPEDAATVWFNPAGMTQLEGRQLSFTLDSLFLPVRFTPDSGNVRRSRNQYFPIPSLYVTTRLPDERWAMGLAVNTPFGLKTDWDADGPFRYATTGGRLTDMNIQPTVAYQLTEQLAIGAGLGIHVFTAELRAQFPWAAVVAGAPDGSFAVKGGATGLGGTTGLYFQPAERHSVGLTYRSQVVASFKNATATLNRNPLPGILGTSGSEFDSVGAKTSIRLPHTAALGYAFRPNDRWLWELDATWRKWNDTKTLTISFDRTLAGVLTGTETPFNWKNSYVFGMGVKHRCTETWNFSAGSIISLSPVQDRDYNALIPDNNYYALTLGAGYTRGNLRVNLPLVVASTFDRRRNPVDVSPGADERGIYRYNALHLGVGLSYTF